MTYTVGTAVSWWLFIATMLRDVTVSAMIENGVVGEPEVECGLEGITVDVVTIHPFMGRLYIQGESDDPNCIASYSGQQKPSHTSEESTNQPIQFSLKFGECNMRRQRTLNPRGVAYTFTLIVSFHPIFETEVDRAYRVRCFFSESVKSLEATLGVSQLTTQIIEQEFALPTCVYEIRESREGPFVKFAHIGETVWHVWRCDLEAGMIYGMLIHSCRVDDGQGNQVPLVDNKGCVLDPLLLSDIKYDDQAITAYAETRVFKYSDKVQLYFTCTVQLCVKSDGGCDDVIPPVCEDSEHHAPPQPSEEFPLADRDQRDDPSHLHHEYESERQFFGQIDNGLRREIDRNLHFTPPPPPLAPTPPSEFDFLRNKSALQISRAKRRISDNFTLVTTTLVSEKNRKHIAETDLTARVVVLPITEIESSNPSTNHKKDMVKLTSPVNSTCFSLMSVFMLIGTTMFLTGATCFAILLLRSKRRAARLNTFTKEKTLTERAADCP